LIMHACRSPLALALALAASASAQNRADEPRAEAFSLEAGVAFLDGATSEWAEARECVTCHTNGLALALWPQVEPEVGARERAFAGRYLTSFVEGGEEPRGQRGALEGLVATTAFLALYDAQSDEGMQPDTRAGLDHAWSQLDADGLWTEWLVCNWPPFESDVEFGPALMLVALGELKDDLSAADRRAARRLRGALDDRPPRSLHDKAMRLWAGRHWPGWPRARDARKWTSELLEAQRDDGGWSMAGLAGAHWRRDEGEQSQESGAYATAFVAHVLGQLGHGEPVARARAWLRGEQRVSGRWFTRSPRRDGKHYISHAATVFALLVLVEDD